MSVSRLVVCNIVLVGRVEGVTYQRAHGRRFTGVTISLPGSTCLLFPKGSVTVVGVKCISAIASISSQLLTVLGASRVSSLRVCNIVGITSVGRRINIPSVYNSLFNTAPLTYTPETFPGMTVRLGGSMVAVVFHTGKIVLMGAKTIEELNTGETKILKMIIG